MTRPAKEKLKKIRSSTVYLLKNTTWKCGRIERNIVRYLRMKMSRLGVAKATVQEILQVAAAKKAGDVYAALRKLQQRGIINWRFEK